MLTIYYKKNQYLTSSYTGKITDIGEPRDISSSSAHPEMYDSTDLNPIQSDFRRLEEELIQRDNLIRKLVTDQIFTEAAERNNRIVWVGQSRHHLLIQINHIPQILKGILNLLKTKNDERIEITIDLINQLSNAPAAKSIAKSPPLTSKRAFKLLDAIEEIFEERISLKQTWKVTVTKIALGLNQKGIINGDATSEKALRQQFYSTSRALRSDLVMLLESIDYINRWPYTRDKNTFGFLQLPSNEVN